MDLSIITVTWNSADRIAEQINSAVLGCREISFEQIVIDNGSKDKTCEIVEKDFPNVKLIKNQKNKGFAGANNQGVEIAQGKYILFLNPDMRVEQGSLDTIVRWVEHKEKIGIASCKLVHSDGKLCEDAKPRRFPKVWERILLILKLPHLVPMILDHYMMKDFNSEVEQEVDSVRGSFMLVRKELTEKLGWGFDPRYFIWWEDVDLCREAKKLGYKVIYTPIITCVDYVGQSFKQQKSSWKQKNFTKSMVIYSQKWEPWYKWIWIKISRPIGMLLSLLNDIFGI